MWWHDEMGWGGWVVMTLSMAAFWSLVVFGGIALLRSGRDSHNDETAHEAGPQQLLDERFAHNEIDVEGYHARQDVLRTSR